MRYEAGILAMGLSLSPLVVPAFAQVPKPPSPETAAEEPPPSEPGPQAPGEAAAESREEPVRGPAPGARTLSLSEAVRLALERNFGLLSQGDSVTAAGFRVGVARAQFLPRLTPRYARTQEGTTFGADASQRLPWLGGTVEGATTFTSNEASTDPTTRNSAASVLLRQPLLRGFGPNASFYDLTNSRRGLETQRRSYELARQRLAIQVASAYYNVIAQRQLLVVSEQSLERSRNLLKASLARLKVGLASKLDVFRAELQAAQTEDAMVRSEAALESANEQLRSLLALPPDDPVEPPALPLEKGSATEPEPTEALRSRALENRLEIKEARDQVADGRRTLSLARQNLLPQLDLTLAVTRLGAGPSYRDAWRSGDTRTTLGFATSYPLERAADKASRALAEVDLASRERALRQRELDVELEVRAAVREIVRILKSVDLQKQAVEVAAQQRRLATLRYERGLASNFDVVDAEGSLVLARSALVSLLASLKVAELELKRSVGELDVDAEFVP